MGLQAVWPRCGMLRKAISTSSYFGFAHKIASLPVVEYGFAKLTKTKLNSDGNHKVTLLLSSRGSRFCSSEYIIIFGG